MIIPALVLHGGSGTLLAKALGLIGLALSIAFFLSPLPTMTRVGLFQRIVNALSKALVSFMHVCTLRFEFRFEERGAFLISARFHILLGF
jgi:hypothetical protein